MKDEEFTKGSTMKKRERRSSRVDEAQVVLHSPGDFSHEFEQTYTCAHALITRP